MRNRRKLNPRKSSTCIKATKAFSRKQNILGSKAQAEAMIRQIYTSNYNRYQMELDSALRSKNGTSVNISKDLAAAAFHHVINQVAIPDNLCMKPGEGDAERPALTDGAAPAQVATA